MSSVCCSITSRVYNSTRRRCQTANDLTDRTDRWGGESSAPLNEIARSQLSKACHLLSLPFLVSPKLFRDQARDSRGDRHARTSVQQEQAGPSRQHVLERPSHFVAHGPEHLGFSVGKIWRE